MEWRRPPSAHSGSGYMAVAGVMDVAKSSWMVMSRGRLGTQTEPFPAGIPGAGGCRGPFLAGGGAERLQCTCCSSAERDRLTKSTGAWRGSQTTDVRTHEGTGAGERPGNSMSACQHVLLPAGQARFQLEGWYSWNQSKGSARNGVRSQGGLRFRHPPRDPRDRKGISTQGLMPYP